MSYGNTTTAIPLAVPMHWVGDTPMITLTDYGIPGMGTFSARVFFYGDRYAGTWQSERAGGHMFGSIVPGGAAANGTAAGGGSGQ